ncbi:hypothetical protein [Halobacterium yunchengense]|uniref:hypothetical protein n=1 Tax=Halobacterium yunchengense TaxID=3108497 RepID=UPI00300AED3F
MTRLDRRRFLKLGTASAASALGGCLHGDGGDGRDPTFADWLPADDGPLLAASLDLAVAEKTSRIDPLLPLLLPSSDDNSPGVLPDLSALDDVDDPLLRFPLRTGGQVVAVSTLALAAAGLDYAVDPATPTTGVTQLFAVDGAIVGTGDLDVERADDALTSGTPGAFGDLQFERAGEIGDYAAYETTESNGDVVALGETAVVAASTRERARTVVATHRGDHDRAVETDDTLGALSETAGSGDVVVGWRDQADISEFFWQSPDLDPASELLAGQDDLLASVTFTPSSDEVTAEFALQNADLNEDGQRRLEDTLGAAAVDASVSVTSDAVSATARYTENALDIEFVDQSEPATTANPPEGDDVPEAVADAVPEDAFEFTYNADEGVVRVDFVAEFDVDEVTVRAVEADSSTSTETPDGVTFLSVVVDSGGDEVVVTVTVDGQTGVVARHDVP